MIDIHSHILPNIDDGARSLDETIEILDKMSNLGFHHIVATPHYITGSTFKCDNEMKFSILNEVQKKLDGRGIDVKLYMGNETYIDMDILSLIDSNKISTINNSRYLLIELPRNGKINDLNELIFTLRSRDIIPIIAHPERYICLQEDNKLVDDLIKRGALLQVNFESINGKYGKEVKKLAVYLLKNKRFHFLASDIHHTDSNFFKNFKKLQKDIIKIVGFETYKEVTYINQSKVLEDEYINGEIKEQPKKKNRLFK